MGRVAKDKETTDESMRLDLKQDMRGKNAKTLHDRTDIPVARITGFADLAS